MIKMKIGFIGYGNMGKMIINNILSLNLLKEEKIIVSNRTIAKLNNLKEKYPKITTTYDNSYLAKNSNKIFIFVKTPDFKKVMNEISPYLDNDTHIIHICAGLDFEEIAIYYDGAVTQIIPSIASTINNEATSNYKRGISLISHNKKVNQKDKEFVENLFNGFSYIKLINIEKEDYNDLNIATILTSCGPAFLALFVKKLAISASSNSNLAIEDTEDMIIKTLFGTSSLLSSSLPLHSDKNKIAMNPDELIEKVATKKGITQKGLDYLDSEFDEVSKELFSKLLKEFK